MVSAAPLVSWTHIMSETFPFSRVSGHSSLLISENQFDPTRVQLSSGRFSFSFSLCQISVCFPVLVFLIGRYKFCKFIARFVRRAHY